MRNFGGHAFVDKGHMTLCDFTGYAPLMPPIIEFFQKGTPPAPEAETIDSYAFMGAAQESRVKKSMPVNVADIVKKAERQRAKVKI
ncbi:hypothetical protein WJU16_03670 [Chitinophaga pollutisoli]|uniref:Uncharacterized protein n=1 Tax=Chitinophaga pollutisoli TaxID=3133966 RepID=A0ABZ2YQS7_9BACT